MSGPATQNARMLASLLGIDEEAAAERLDRSILVTCANDTASSTWAVEIETLLQRTVTVVGDPADADLELIVGAAEGRSKAPHLWAAISASEAVVSSTRVKMSGTVPHGLFAAAAACPVAAAALRAVIGSDSLPQVPDPLRIRLSQFGIPQNLPNLDLTGSVLVGAGAVANGFLRALRHVSAQGELAIVDPKTVADGNLNRCLYFEPRDVDAPKADALAARAQGDFPHLRLYPLVERFDAYARRAGRIRRAIVTVDSREVRRSIQKFLPGEIVDASTTDAQAVVVHSHRQPTDHACLACIYKHVSQEDVRTRAIAEGLGLDVTTVQQGFITPEAAELITLAHPQTDPATLVGKAFDTLYRELCSTQALITPEGRQVLAPFAFVSAFAGALLVIELLRRQAGVASTNYWQLSPWRDPVDRARQLRLPDPDCEFCSRPESREAALQMWQGSL